MIFFWIILFLYGVSILQLFFHVLYFELFASGTREADIPILQDCPNTRPVSTPNTPSNTLSARHGKHEASDWSRSFETLQTKRSQFVNSSTPRFEETIPLYPLEGAKSPTKAIRHYSFYMPDVSFYYRNCFSHETDVLFLPNLPEKLFYITPSI